MLGRTAANLFWLARYIERAENTARMLEVGTRMALTARRETGTGDHLMSMMQAAEVDEAFKAKYDRADVETVSRFMLLDADNLSSVRSCLLAARTNARSVRTAITSDMWEAINSSWLEFSKTGPEDVVGAKLPSILSWIKRVSNQFRGALMGTLLRDDGYAFLQAGIYVERADNTARILDMKYYVLLPRATAVGGDIDIQQWTLILRAASAHRSYRHVYHDRYKPWNIADFLILRPEMPRSLIACAQGIEQSLDMLASIYGQALPCHDNASALLGMMENMTMDKIFSSGLHEFLTEFIARNNALTESLSDSYNFY